MDLFEPITPTPQRCSDMVLHLWAQVPGPPLVFILHLRPEGRGSHHARRILLRISQQSLRHLGIVAMAR